MARIHVPNIVRLRLLGLIRKSRFEGSNKVGSKREPRVQDERSEITRNRIVL